MTRGKMKSIEQGMTTLEVEVTNVNRPEFFGDQVS
jgi:hypothetical protein